MDFPVAGIEINPLLSVLIAFIISFFTSMGGISGAFLLLPFQVSILGFTTPAVSSTNLLYNTISIPGGVYRYIKEGRMLWPLSGIIIIGTLPGIISGTLIRIHYLHNPNDFKLFVGIVLLYIGIRLLKDILTSRKSKPKNISAENRFRKQIQGNQRENTKHKPVPMVSVKRITVKKFIYEFNEQEFSINVPALSCVSFFVGIIGGIYGVGGGAIIAPLLISLFNLPVYSIAGAVLMSTFITSLAGVGFYEILSLHYSINSISPDWILGLLFGIGGFAGMYAGAKFQKYFPASIIKWILVCCILFIAVKYMIEFI